MGKSVHMLVSFQDLSHSSRVNEEASSLPHCHGSLSHSGGLPCSPAAAAAAGAVSLHSKHSQNRTDWQTLPSSPGLAQDIWDVKEVTNKQEARTCLTTVSSHDNALPQPQRNPTKPGFRGFALQRVCHSFPFKEVGRIVMILQ